MMSGPALSRGGTVPLVASGGGQGTGTFTLYPVFASPEEEYKYISSRMAELERHLGMAAGLATSCVTLPPPSATPTPKKKVKKEKTKKKKEKKDEGKKEKKEKRKKEGSEIKKKTKKKDKTTKAKKKSTKAKTLNKEKEAAASDLDTSQEQDCTVSVDKAKELERDSVCVEVPDQLQAIDQELRGSTTSAEGESDESSSKPRLRKAASFLFNKTSEMRSYFRKMSADIRDMASPSSTKEMDAAAQTSATTSKDQPFFKKSPSFKKTKKSTKANRKRQRRSAQEGPYNASSSGDDLNNMQHDSDSDDGSQLTYDARYTDAVFVFSSSSDSRQLHPVVGHHNYGHLTISDHETFSIMIEEDTATYDSPTMLPTTMPEVEIDIELDEASDDDGEIDHHRTTPARATTDQATAAGPRHSVASWGRPAALPPVLLRVPTSPAAATSLASKASYRMTMPPVLPPSDAQPPHPASRQSPQPRTQLHQLPGLPADLAHRPPFSSGWGARRPLPPIPAHGGRTRSYAHSSGAVPTSARPRTGTCIC